MSSCKTDCFLQFDLSKVADALVFLYFSTELAQIFKRALGHLTLIIYFVCGTHQPPQ
jgi:hypothetical protein